MQGYLAARRVGCAAWSTSTRRAAPTGATWSRPASAQRPHQRRSRPPTRWWATRRRSSARSRPAAAASPRARQPARTTSPQRRHARPDRPLSLHRRDRPAAHAGRGRLTATRSSSCSSTAPDTDASGSGPLLIVPPPIGRYYFLDLRPGRSFVEYAVAQGFQVFLISWRNPTPEQADWDLDTYAARRGAVDVARDVTGSPDVNTLGFCAGGILDQHRAQPPRGERGQQHRERRVRRHPARLRQPGAARGVLLTAAARSSPARAPSGPGSSARGRWGWSSPGCAPTTWCSTTWSTSG